MCSLFGVLLLKHLFSQFYTMQDSCRLGGDRIWPSVAETWQYRQEVRRVVLAIIDNAPFELPLVHRDPWVRL